MGNVITEKTTHLQTHHFLKPCCLSAADFNAVSTFEGDYQASVKPRLNGLHPAQVDDVLAAGSKEGLLVQSLVQGIQRLMDHGFEVVKIDFDVIAIRLKKSHIG